MEEFEIVRGSKRIYGKIAFPRGKGPHPLVVFSHGFGASHVYDSGMERPFVESGFAFAAFDFCGGGPESQSSGTMKEMSVLTEADDLEAVIDWARGLARIDGSRVFLLGSSQGGYVSTYVASRRPDDVAALALFFPAFCIEDDARAKLEEFGGAVPDEVQVGPHMVGRRYIEDALSVDVFELMREYPSDVLIVHGAMDRIVPVEFSHRAAATFPGHCTLEVFEELGHGFRTSPPELHERALGMAIEFFRAHALRNAGNAI